MKILTLMTVIYDLRNDLCVDRDLVHTTIDIKRIISNFEKNNTKFSRVPPQKWDSVRDMKF